MSEVVSFVGYQPPVRLDSLPWTQVQIEESATEGGVYVQIDSLALSPLDVDPATPAYRSFTTENGSQLDYWYRIVWSDGDGDVSVPTVPVQNSAGADVSTTAYATVAELQRRVGKEAGTTPAEAAAMELMLLAAAEKTNWEVGTVPFPTPATVVNVNLRYAQDLWRLSKSTFGSIPQGADLGSIIAPRDIWYRYQIDLAPYRMHHGVA